MLDIVLEIRKFLSSLSSIISWDMLLYLAVGFELLMIVFFIIKSRYSYEMRMERVLYKLNRWLNVNQYIDQNNLIDFNALMKRTPKLMRYHWHQYMLYREKDPSFYMSPYNLIEKPLKTSSFVSNIKNLKLINYSVAILAFVLGLTFISTSAFTTLEFAQCLVIPAIIIIVNSIATMFLRARKDSNLSKFYLYFHYFNRKLDKAVTTMPDYVDFEVLFTRKEIRQGIPVLNEYLEKRARQEKEELEKARLNAVEHETFNFEEAGIDGSLVLDRAMKECETYINFRQRTLGEIQQLESEVDSLKRNYENTQKDYQRKLQASKENVDRLRKQQEESTNRIESNYIKKQQQDEVKKQEQLERDFDDSTIRFNNDVQTLMADIASKREELEEHRKIVEDAMKAEYQTFSSKVYEQVAKTVDERVTAEKQSILRMKDGISDDLQEANYVIEAQKNEIEALRKALIKAGVSPAEFEYLNEALRAEAKKVKAGKKNLFDRKEETSDVPETSVEEQSFVPEILPEEPAEERPEVLPEQTLEVAEQTPEEENKEPEYDEYGGYYDDEGYYRYANGTYYDPQGNYHDEFGGVYDAEGNYTPPAESVKESPEEISGEQNLNNENLEDTEVAVESQETESENVEGIIPEEQPVEEVEGFVPEMLPPEDETIEETVIVPEEQVNEVSEELPEVQEEKELAKKRGRPRKVVNQDEVVTEPKKRGRPRKVVDETQPVVKRGRGRPRKQTAEDTPKKSVGRPKKETTEDTPKKSVGRPKKETTQTEKKSVGRPKKETSTTTTEAKKRGRPRKEEVAPITEKKSVGRPRKVSTETATPAKKRGRPKKVVNETEVKKEPKKRGRPRKTQDSLDEIKKLNEQILEENLKLQRQQAELNSQLGQTLSQLDGNKKSNQE